MSNQEHFPEDNQGLTREQLKHSGVHGYEQPVREYDTPLEEAPLDYDPRKEDELHTGHLPEELRATPAQTKERKPWHKNTAVRIGGAVAGLIAAVGVGVGVTGGGGDEAPKKDNSPELVVGPDGEPVQFVEYSLSGPNADRNNDGADDAITDTNENGIQDASELWDQTKKEFVDPRAGDDEAALENASPEDIQNIETLAPVMEGVAHWQADFIALEPAVKQYIMLLYRDQDQFESELDFQSSIIEALRYTTEDLEGLSQAN
ncbi:MAG TPA: hypothetical protein VGE13_00160 [Candidatus Saccharimonadales bacterium]